YVDKLDSAGGDELSRATGRLTPRVRLEQVRFPVLVQSASPSLERNFALLGLPGEWRSGRSSATLPVRDRRLRFTLGQNRPAVRLPNPFFFRRGTEAYAAVRPPRCRARRQRRTSTILAECRLRYRRRQHDRCCRDEDNSRTISHAGLLTSLDDALAGCR